MTNEKVKQYAKSNGVYLWQVAKAMNVSVDTFTRKMREELTKEDILKLEKVIDKISKENVNKNKKFF